MTEARFITHLQVDRMTTSREDETKHEHFTTLVDNAGRKMTQHMRYDPQEALFQTMELAKFMGVPCKPLIIDGKIVELVEFYQSLLENES